MTTNRDDYSRNGVPLKGPTSGVTSNLSGGQGAPTQVGMQTTAKGGSTDYVRNPVPLEGDLVATGDGKDPPGKDWLQLASENFRVSQNWFDISVRRRVEDNLAHTYSRHASGSRQVRIQPTRMTARISQVIFGN